MGSVWGPGSLFWSLLGVCGVQVAFSGLEQGFEKEQGFLVTQVVSQGFLGAGFLVKSEF